MARQSFMQTAQENIRKNLFEGCEAQFFKGMNVIAADPGDIVAKVSKALSGVGFCVVVEVPGGPAPIPEDPTEWDARVSVVERPPVNRQRENGKTADVVVDAILRSFANGGHFRPTRVVPAHTEKETCFVVEGKTTIVLSSAANGGGEC